MTDIATVIGFAAAAASTSSFVPQAWKIIKTRETAGISVITYMITVVGFGLWLGYGVLLDKWPLILTNAICLLLSAFILLMKVLSRGDREAVAKTIAG